MQIRRGFSGVPPSIRHWPGRWIVNNGKPIPHLRIYARHKAKSLHTQPSTLWAIGEWPATHRGGDWHAGSVLSSSWGNWRFGQGRSRTGRGTQLAVFSEPLRTQQSREAIHTSALLEFKWTIIGGRDCEVGVQNHQPGHILVKIAVSSDHWPHNPRVHFFRLHKLSK